MKISLVIPTYNRSGLLLELLNSIRKQGHRPVECIVVDDGSTDRTAATVRDFSYAVASDDGLTVSYKAISKQGAQVARNEGIRMARGEAVIFVDSDDVLAADGLRRLAEELEAQPELSYSYGRVEMVDQNLSPLTPGQIVGAPYNIQNPEDLMGYHWHTMGALYRRSCIEKVGLWNPELTGSQDWEYQARVKLFGGSGSFLPVLVGYWRQHAESRVGTASFRPDYVTSVMKACASILAHAKEAGKCDHALERKISKRLLVHAIAFGGAGYQQEKKACLAQAAQAAQDDPQLKSIIKLLQWSPQPVDSIADAAARWIQGRP